MSVDVLVIIDSLNRGGCEQALVRLLNKMSKPKIELATVFEAGVLADKLAVKIHSNRLAGFLRHSSYRLLKILSYAWAWLGLFYIIIKVRPKVIHCYLPTAYVLAGSISFLLPRTKLVMSRRSLNNYQDNHRFLKQIEAILHKRCNLILANSQAVKHNLLAEGVPENKIQLIYNGIDTSSVHLTKLDAREQLNIKPSTLVMLYVGNLYLYKGHLELLRALAQVSDKLPDDWLLILAGRREHESDLIFDAIRDLDLNEHVQYLGEVEQPDVYYQACDISFLVSHQEGFSNTLLESMLNGCQIIATDVGGNAEALNNEECGLLVPACSADDIADGIVKVLLDQDAAHHRAQQAQSRVQQCFALDEIALSYQALYDYFLISSKKAVAT